MKLGRHEYDVERRADTIGTRAGGCKLARGDCQACRKTKASQASGRHAWRKHVGNSKGQKRLGEGSHAQLFIRPRCWATSYIEERAQCECVRECCIISAHMEARGREELMTCWGNAHETLRRHRWQKLVGKAREGHNKWRADTHGTYGRGCKY